MLLRESVMGVHWGWIVAMGGMEVYEWGISRRFGLRKVRV